VGALDKMGGAQCSDEFVTLVLKPISISREAATNRQHTAVNHAPGVRSMSPLNAPYSDNLPHER